MPELERQMMLALERFTLSLTVPVLYDRGESLDQLGTGTLFEHNNSHFLVTARHILEDEDIERVALPARPRGPETFTLGAVEVIQYRDPVEMDIDVVILKLLSAPAVAELRAGWRFLTMQNTATATPQGAFVLCGFPTQRMIPRGGDLSGSVVTCYTTRLPNVPVEAKAPIDDRIDFFLDYQREAKDFYGDTVRAVDLKGLSGSAVWQYFPVAENDIWTPESTLKVVGVQASFRTGDFSRVKSWEFVKHALNSA